MTDQNEKLERELHALILDERYDDAIQLHKTGVELLCYMADPIHAMNNAENNGEASKYLKFFFTLDPKYTSDEWFGNIARAMIIGNRFFPFRILQTCMNHGLDINKRYNIYNSKKTRLDYILVTAFKETSTGINLKRCNEAALKICEMGADPNVEDNYLIRTFLRNKCFDDAQKLMKSVSYTHLTLPTKA